MWSPPRRARVCRRCCRRCSDRDRRSAKSDEAASRSAAQDRAGIRDARSSRQFRRIVVKVGSSLLVDRARGRLNHAWLAALAEDIADLHARGADVLVVSSGAIAMGRTVLGLAAGRAEARGEPGGGRRRADRARAHLGGGAGASRHHGGPDPADARGYRGAPPLPQRPRDDPASCSSCARCP